MAFVELPTTGQLGKVESSAPIIPEMAALNTQRSDLNRALFAGDIDTDTYTQMMTDLRQQAADLRDQYGLHQNTRVVNQLQPS